jgi:hypothetical protein
LAFECVGLDDRPFRRVELPGFVDDLLGDRDLADVVQERSELQVAALLGGQLEMVRDDEREFNRLSCRVGGEWMAAVARNRLLSAGFVAA